MTTTVRAPCMEERTVQPNRRNAENVLWKGTTQLCATHTKLSKDWKKNVTQYGVGLVYYWRLSCTKYCRVVFSHYFACQPDRGRTPRWPFRRFHRGWVVTANGMGQLGAASGHQSLLSASHRFVWGCSRWVVTWIPTPTCRISAINLALYNPADKDCVQTNRAGMWGWTFRLSKTAYRLTERECEAGHFDYQRLRTD